MTEYDPEDQPDGPQPGEAAYGRAINTGISITGGTISGVVAGGQNAHVTVNQGGSGDDRLAQVEQLLAKLEAGARALDAQEAEQMRDDVGRLRGELRHERPDQGWVSHLLARLTVLAAPVASLLELVNQVKDLIH